MSEPERDPDEGDWPPATIGLATAILVVFALEHWAGVEDRPSIAGLRCGAVEHGAVFLAGESWRLLPAAFVHFPLRGAPPASAGDAVLSLPHVLLNGWALIQVGAFVESVWGTARLLVVFLLSAIGCSLASAWFSPAVAAGASGGIFGILGFLLAARVLGPAPVAALVKATFGAQLFFWAGLVIAIGATGLLPIDQAGHLGGLAAGLVLGAVLRDTGPAGPLVRGLATALVLATASPFAVVARDGDKAARLESGLEDAVQAAQEPDREAAGRALDQTLAAADGRFERVVGRSPARALGLIEAAVAAVRTSDAVRFAEEAARRFPAQADAFEATAHLASGEVDRAREELARAHLPLAERLELALFYERQGWSGPALQLLQSALGEHADDPGILNAVAWILLTAKDERFREPRRGLELARRAVEQAPDQAESLDTLAEGESQAGLASEAVAHERRALDLARAARNERLIRELETRLGKMQSTSR